MNYIKHIYKGSYILLDRTRGLRLDLECSEEAVKKFGFAEITWFDEDSYSLTDHQTFFSTLNLDYVNQKSWN